MCKQHGTKVESKSRDRAQDGKRDRDTQHLDASVGGHGRQAEGDPPGGYGKGGSALLA